MEPSLRGIPSTCQWSAIFSQIKAAAEAADRARVELARHRLATEALAQTGARRQMTALIIADVGLAHESFSDAVAHLGLHSVTVGQPLDAIACLQDDALAIGVVLAPADDARFPALEFFVFVRGSFPHIRRLASGGHDSEPLAAALASGLVHDVLTCPPLQGLGEALRPAPQAMSPKRDERSDKQLLQAWKHSDRDAFQELDRRYRLPIHQLATALRFSDEDADEIVQDTLLALLLGGGSKSDSVPDQFICGLVTATVLVRLRSDQRRTRLLSRLARSAARARTDRELREQPDERLLSLELAGRADAAICDLPPRCREAFWLRAVEGCSARHAGATLHVAASVVDERLLHARRLIAEDLRPYLAQDRVGTHPWPSSGERQSTSEVRA